MFCEKCGAQIGDDEKFCDKCGYPTNMMGKKVDKKQQVKNEKAKMSSFQKSVIAILIVFGIVFLILVWFGMQAMNRNEREQQRLEAERAEAALEIEKVNEKYAIYCGTYELTNVMEDGEWKAYGIGSKLTGKVVDLIAAWKLGIETETYSAPQITIGADGVDLSAINQGRYIVSEFYYEEIEGMDFFIHETEEFALASDGNCIYYALPSEEGVWYFYYMFE